MVESIGQQLRTAREARSLTLEQIAQATHMRAHYLQAMEAGDFDALPSIAQARGFLRTYATFLRLNPDPLLSVLDGNPSNMAAPDLPTPTRPVEREAAPSLEAEAIFAEVGQRLQHQRELLGLSLDDVVRHTHLRRHYLVALEAGNLADLPSPVQGRGMLNNYAAFLGLDPEPMLLRFAEGLQARLAVRRADHQETNPKTRPAPARRNPLPAPLRRLLSGDLLIGGTLAVFLVVFVVWGAIRIFAMRSVDLPSPTAPSIADVLLAPASETPTPTLAEATSTGPAQLINVVTEAPITDTPAQDTTEEVNGTPEPQQSVQIYITVHQRAWMRVLVDGKVEFEGRVLAGSAYSFAGEKRVEILTGNGAALQIFYNQQDLGLMGLFGQVVNQVYSLEGIETPTPTVTPTGTATPRVSPTPRQSATPPGILPPRTPTLPALP